MELRRTDEVFAHVPDRFISPFPSNGQQLDNWVQGVVETFGGAGASDRRIEVAQTKAWTTTVQMAYEAKATGALDLLTSQFHDLVQYDADGALRGMFADVDPIQLANKGPGAALADIAFTVATNLLSAIPVVGGALSSLARVGRMAVRLFRAGREEQEVLVPWIEGDFRLTDEDFVGVIQQQAMPGVDWTPLFMPSLDITNAVFELRTTEKGDWTRSFGPYRGDTLSWGGGLGAMPGSTRLVSPVQLRQDGRRDRYAVVNNIGDFLPSTTEFTKALWSMAAAPGPDLYKIDTHALERAWTDFFGEMFEQAFALFNRLGGENPGTDGYWEQVMLARCMAPFVAYRQSDGKWGTLDLSAVEDARIPPSAMDGKKHKLYPTQPQGLELAPIHEAILIPAIRTLRQRQEVMLARSLSSAYVRKPGDPGGDPYIAFVADAALADRCRDMRNMLLQRDARHLVNLGDVALINPRMLTRLEESGVSQPASGPVVGATAMAGADLSESPLLAGVAPADPTKPPQGSDLFPDSVLPKRRKGGGGAALMAAAAAAFLWSRRR